MVSPFPVVASARSRAAQALLEARLTAEGIRLARQALVLALPFLDGHEHARAAALLRAPEPLLERDVTPADVERAWAALELVRKRRPGSSLSRRQRAFVATLALLFLVGLAWSIGRTPAVSAVASSSYSSIPVQGPDAVLDEDDQSNWLLPDRIAGWIELRFASPRSVSAVEITNGRNPPYGDRGAGAVEVVLVAEDGAILERARHELSASAPAAPERIDVGADGVLRVRVFVRSFRGLGGALDRIRVLP